MVLILLVDDDRDQLGLRRMNFERHGYRVATAETSEQAVAEFAAQPADVVLMDLCLPRMEDGRELIRRLRDMSPAVRIVVLSGCPEDLSLSPEAEMVDHCFRKPVRSETVLRTVKRLAGGA